MYYCRKNNIEYHNDINKPYDLHIFWSPTKTKIKPDSITLEYPNVINRGCYDVTKYRVNEIYNDISINPETHKGICVAKLDRQCSHDKHKLVECPTKKEKGYVYQKFIEDKDENGNYIYYRIMYADGIKLIVKRKKKSIFITDSVSSEIVPVDSIFNKEQEEDFNNKCKNFGVDYAEIDVMLDNGVPIVVDVNNVAGYRIGISMMDEKEKVFLEFINNRANDKSM
jgi:hypothetical protein